MSVKPHIEITTKTTQLTVNAENCSPQLPLCMRSEQYQDLYSKRFCSLADSFFSVGAASGVGFQWCTPLSTLVLPLPVDLPFPFPLLKPFLKSAVSSIISFELLFPLPDCAACCTDPC